MRIVKNVSIGAVFMMFTGLLFPHETGNEFLVLNDKRIEYIDGNIVLTSNFLKRVNSDKLEEYLIDGNIFLINHEYIKKLEQEKSKRNAMKEIVINNNNEILYNGFGVYLGNVQIKRLLSALHWKNWIVCVGSIIQPKPKSFSEAVIRGDSPSWYFIWFEEKNLHGGIIPLPQVGSGQFHIFTNYQNKE